MKFVRSRFIFLLCSAKIEPMREIMRIKQRQFSSKLTLNHEIDSLIRIQEKENKNQIYIQIDVLNYDLIEGKGVGKKNSFVVVRFSSHNFGRQSDRATLVDCECVFFLIFISSQAMEIYDYDIEITTSSNQIIRCLS